MNVKIIKVATAEEVGALIKKGKSSEMPSMQQNWRFNFDKELKKLTGATGYVFSNGRIAGCDRGVHDFYAKQKNSSLHVLC